MIGRARPAVAIFTFALLLTAVLASAGSTLGYDFAAFREAGARVISGARLYDVSAAVAGPQGLYLYPPPFAIAMVPFALLPAQLATWSWIALMTLALLASIALMPVRADVRWLVLLLAGLDWPVLYSLKLGQVGPLLVLVFVVAWRWVEHPDALGLAGALGTLIKIQPAVLFLWAAIARRWRTVLVGLMATATVVAASVLVVGPSAWVEYAALLLRINAPVTTPHLVTPGAVVHSLGVSDEMASAVQWLTVALAILAFITAAVFGTPTQGILAASLVSQLVSPVVWDHYAIILLVPVAFLLDRGIWPASLLVLVTALPLATVTPPAVYPIDFAISMVCVVVTVLKPLLDNRRAAIREPIFSGLGER